MKEIGKLLTLEGVFRDRQKAKNLLKHNPLLLIISCQPEEVSEADEFYFHFRADHNFQQSRPLLLGSRNARCGEYLQDSGHDVTFNEMGYLTDSLSCMLSLHLLKELKASMHVDASHVHHMAISLMSYLKKKYLEFKVKEQLRFKGGISGFRLKKIEEYVLSSVSRAVHVAELAEIAGTSIFYFVRMFKQSTGETPYQFISRLKINKAKELLTNTSMKIIEVGYEVGFDDPGHFARAFKKQQGITPSGFRKLLSKNTFEYQP